jgi:hypothetical protein
MVDLNLALGREIPTAREVLEVIRPQLRLAAVIFPVVHFTFETHAFVGEGRDEEPSLGSDDQCASDSVFDALRESALASVADWARDLGKVYDKGKLTTFVGFALNEAANGTPSDALLDVLALDEGTCENIGVTLRRLGVELDGIGGTDDRMLAASAAYFQRV